MAAPDYVYGDGHITEFNIVCAAVILVIGIPGIFVNVITLIMLRTLPSFKNSFGSLCTSRCVSNFIFLVIMVTMTAVPGLYQPVHLSYFLSARTGQIMMLTNHSTMISHVIIAINRFMALFWTSMVAKVFNSGWLFVIIFIQWLISVLYVVPLSFDWLQCNFIFETNAVSFMFQDNYCTRIMSTIDFYIQVFDCTMLVILNCTAFLNLMFRHKELNKVTDRFQKQRIRTRNLRFFAQEIIHAALFVFDFMNYAFIFPHVAQYPFLKFFFGDGLWVFVFAADSAILIAFNSEMRIWVRRHIFRSKNVGVTVPVTIPSSRNVSNVSIIVQAAP
ncbi:hypothetical protein L596_017443 [Steinernema carpocapsae]|uniref:G-protein coupled receptors family 1 profile domain-containing protein n=1 Tax=Steinernema carpocapsae TaxID=34508 RepID=A0A4U5N227_STECR|nr:hypothetical protein L596_017443 [Steinernema carpocapsae]